MNKHSIYLFLLSAISLNVQAIGADIVPASDRFSSCFIDDASESVCWKKMLTESSPAVRYDFGVHYANGDGVKQDFTKGRYWMHQAALKDFPLAQYNLGVMFFDGIGGAQSKECAVHWLNKSASEGGEIREMAQQALAALYELAASTGGAKVYRMLTVTECEQLPEVAFPEGEIAPAQSDKTPDSAAGIDEIEQVQDAPVTLSSGVDESSANVLAEPEQTALIEPEARPAPLTSFQEKMVRHFIQPGHPLLGKGTCSENDTFRVNALGPMIHPEEEGAFTEMISVEPEPVVPLFVGHILDHQEKTADDPLNEIAITPDEDEAEAPLDASPAEVIEPTITLSETGGPEVTLSSSADETGRLTSPEKEESRLPVNREILEWVPVDVLPAAVAPQVSEPAEAVAPRVPDIALQREKKAVPRTLNLGGALHNAPKEHYTLQLSSASQAEPLQVLAKKHKLSNYLVYETQRHGRLWYVLVYGEYAGMTQAKKALQQLPGSLKSNTPWIRSLAQVHAEL